MRVLFGRYAGTPVPDLPDPYLRWLNARPWLYGALREAVEREHRQRFGAQRPLLVPSLPEPVREAARRIVTAGYRAVAREVHPDVGGDVGAMRHANAAAEALRELLA